MNKHSKTREIVKQDPFFEAVTRLFNQTWNEFRLMRVKKILQSHYKVTKSI